MTTYDIVIIGGGIAGIYSMYNLKKKYPKLKVILLEKEDRFGGRIYTYKKNYNNKNYYIDLGAMRFKNSHLNIIKLIEELNLKNEKIELYSDTTYIYNKYNYAYDNTKKIKKIFTQLFTFLNSNKIKNLDSNILNKFTFIEFLKKYYNNNYLSSIINFWGYKSNLFNMNANEIIKYNINSYNNNYKFFTLKNGMSGLIENMINKINNNTNYILKKNCQVNNIQYNNNLYIIDYINNKNNKKNIINSKYIICGIQKNDLIKFDILKPFNSLLNSIIITSLTKIYQIYDNNILNIVNDGNKIITNNELGIIIPIKNQEGLILSSYTDYNSKYWNRLYLNNKRDFKKILVNKLKEIYSLFNINIDYKCITIFYHWKYGKASWKKNIDSEYIYKKILNLLPNFFICGSNYSHKQAWCEGALDTSNEILNILYNKLNKTYKNNSNKIKYQKNNKTSKKNINIYK